jgi:hypothetical protein
MKKVVLSIVVMFFVAGAFQAQAQRIEKGKVIVGAGAYLERTATPILLTAEYGLGEQIGVGGIMWIAKGYSFLGGRANYHLNNVLNLSNDKMDTYAGLTAGKILNASSGVSMFLHGGGRYFFSDKLGVFTELNIGVLKSQGSSLGAGLAINLK